MANFTATNSPFQALLEKHRPDLQPYKSLYKHFHANGELSTQESSTAKQIAEHLRQLSPDFDIRTGIGGHGLIAILKNGPGKTVLFRADTDALPVREKTGLDYASKKEMQDTDGLVKPVMHGTLALSHRIWIPKVSLG